MDQVTIYPVIMKLILVLLSTPTAAQDTGNINVICSTQQIKAPAGDEVILPCRLEPPINADSMTVEWTRPDLDPENIHVYQDGRFLSESQNPSYNFRTNLFVDELINGNVSLKLSRVTTSDTGKYRCFLPSIHKEAFIQLTVVESHVTVSREPTVAVVGDHVILPCHLEPPFNVTSLRVEWKFGKSFVHVYRSREDDAALQEEKFRSRTSLFYDEMHKGNISLKLTNVTEADAGNYTCYVPKLQSQVKRGYVTLIVDPVENKRKHVDDLTTNPHPDKKNIDSHSTGVTSGVMVGVVVGVVVGAVVCVLVAVIGVYIWRRPNICPTQGRSGQNRPNVEGNRKNIHESIPLASSGNTDNMDNIINVENTNNQDNADTHYHPDDMENIDNVDNTDNVGDADNVANTHNLDNTDVDNTSI